MGEEVIDPITALAGIQAAVALVKKVSKTVDDVSSLGPVLGKYFDAKHTATQAVQQAKKTKSSMAIATEIELSLDQAKIFEEDMKLIFMAVGKVDVFNKIKARSAQMDKNAAIEERQEKLKAKRREEEMDEVVSIVLVIVLTLVLLGTLGYFVYEALQLCQGKCAFQK